MSRSDRAPIHSDSGSHDPNQPVCPATSYHVHGDRPLTLRVGVFNPALVLLHKSLRVESSAFITACRPLIPAHDDAVTLNLQAELVGELQFRSLGLIDGIVRHPLDQQPDESGVLVLGISREAAKVLGLRYGKNAILWIGVDAVPEMVPLP